MHCIILQNNDTCILHACKANQVMTDSEHSLEICISHNVHKCHDHEEQTKSEENGWCQHGTVATMRMKWVCLCGRVLYMVVEG